MRYVTALEMKEIDRRAIEEYGIPASRLMGNAGTAVAEAAMKLAPSGVVAVFCGFGNNGGDGLVAARHLAKKGYSVKVFFVGEPKAFTPETNSNLESLLSINIQPVFISKEEDIEKTFASLGKPGVIIDAIFGIGLKGSLDLFYIKLINDINKLGAPVVSADIPSGLDADTGKALPVAIHAKTTVTFGYPKVGFKNDDAKGYVGKLVIADIGLPSEETKSAKIKHVGKVLHLRSGKKGVVRAGHPWIFKGQISHAKQAGSQGQIKPGEIITVADGKNKFLGRGYYNPKSEITVRILTFKDEPINKDFFDTRIKAAFEKRAAIKTITNAYRVVFSEADSLPGLIIDLYYDTAVFQVLTLGMEKLKLMITGSIRDVLKPKYIYEKSVSPFRRIEDLKDITMWWGDKGASQVEIFEGKARFLVDIENSHKTGFYLDQRRSRMALEGFCKDKSVLDLFCYTGGFSVSACLYGAKSVLGIDIKEDWLKIAGENAKLNGIAERVEFKKGDSFLALKEIFESGKKFDVIILDPPSFLKKRESLISASKGYLELNTLAMKVLSEDGILATFSCSHNMSNEIFSGVLKKAASSSGKKTSILKRCHQAEDHPIVRAIPETEYLKGYFLQVNSI